MPAYNYYFSLFKAKINNRDFRIHYVKVPGHLKQ